MVVVLQVNVESKYLADAMVLNSSNHNIENKDPLCFRAPSPHRTVENQR